MILTYYLGLVTHLMYYLRNRFIDPTAVVIILRELFKNASHDEIGATLRNRVNFLLRRWELQSERDWGGLREKEGGAVVCEGKHNIIKTKGVLGGWRRALGTRT